MEQAATIGAALTRGRGASEVQRKQRPEDVGATGAAHAHKVQLRSMSFDDGAAYLSPDADTSTGRAPVQAKMAPGAGLAPVQLKDTTKPTIDKLDPATIGRVVTRLKASPVWASMVVNYKALTQDGKVPLPRSAEDDIFLELLIAVESMYAFAEGLDIGMLLDDKNVRSRLLGLVKKDATPEPPAPEPEKPKVAIPKVGDFGMLTADTELVQADGTKVPLKAGYAVESKGASDDGMLKVLVHSGKGVEGTVDPKLFKQQPRISKDDDGKTKDYTYEKFAGKAFLGEPSVMDVDQGSLGDCYLIAGMGAVAAASPEVIKNALKDNGDGTYTVTFYELQRDGRTFKPHTETVDNYLPARAGGKRTAYAQSDTAFNPDKQALWPAIIEKAYAQWKGGYEAIGHGGQSSKAMEALTGVKSVRAAMPKEEDVIATFKKWQEDNQAVVCGTYDFVQQRDKADLFQGSGLGPYKGTLTDSEGNAAEIVKGTVRISDKERPGSTARDDKKGKLSGGGVDSGAIAYDTGVTELTYDKDNGPKAATDLEASYQFEGTLNQSLNIHGDHAYMFRGVEGETLLFHNPWGPAAHKHPKPVTAAQFREYFQTIGVNATVPKKHE